MRKQALGWKKTKTYLTNTNTLSRTLYQRFKLRLETSMLFKTQHNIKHQPITIIDRDTTVEYWQGYEVVCYMASPSNLHAAKIYKFTELDRYP